MKFKRHIKFINGLDQINMAPMINLILLILIFLMLSFAPAFQAGIKVKLPKAVISDTLMEENLIISITSEDIIYLNNKVTSIDELTQELGKPRNKTKPILIKADRRASLGRAVDIWDLCRRLGIERINIAANKDQ